MKLARITTWSLLLFVAAGCPGPSKTDVTVSISPSSATVAAGADQQFTATVAGTTNTAVTWSVQEAGGGAISAAGVYTGPATAGAYTVIATSVADTTKSATAAVTVTGNTVVAVAISPKTASIEAGAQQVFTAAVTGSSNTAVTWSVQESGGGTVTDGTYTAPGVAGTYHVVATSSADTSKSDTATVTVTTPPNVVVTVSPAATSVNPGQQVAFTATVTGPVNTAVTWAVQEANGGTISTAGLYTAPATTGAFTVVATSVADTSKSATATVTVTNNPVVAVTISPKTVTIMVGALQSFSAGVTGTSNTAVTWSVLESGGGTVSGGTYTAPATAGTFHVVATSVADTSKSDAATVTVSSTPVVSVSLNPTSASVLIGATQSFTATVSGNSNTAVTWSVQPSSGGGSIAPSGTTAVYTAPSTAGTYQVTATSVADTAKSATANVMVALPAGPMMSGTVAYTGTKTGRVYLALQNGGGGQGTSLSAPGAFTIRGLQGSGNGVMVKAFLDTLGTGTFNYVADPTGSANVTLTGANITGVTVTLADPPAPTTPGQAPTPFVIPAADSLIVGLESLRDNQGQEVATAYNLYWSTTANPGPSNKAAGAPKTFTAGGVGAVYLGSPSVAAGSAYYFSVSAKNGTLEGPVSTAVGPVTVAELTGGTTVSGQVAFPGVTVTGPFIVGIYSDSSGANYVRVTGTTSPQSFSIPGVQPGNYQLFSAIDANGDGAFGIGDPQVGFGDKGQGLTVAGTAVSGLSLTLAASDSTASVRTRHGKNGGADQYQLELALESGLKRPVKVALTSGPNVNVPVDVGLEMNGGGGSSRHRLQWQLGTTGPTVGQTFAFDVTYQDGTTGTVSAPVVGVITGLPTALTPSGPGASTTPTLTWTLPGSLPSPYSLRVWVGGNNGGWDYSFGPGVTSVLYGVDGKAGPLNYGNSYNWSIDVIDQYGNQASDGQQFSVGGVAVSIIPKNVTVTVGAQQSFTATVTGSGNPAVTWSVQEAGGGTISGGTYTAPATTGTYHVVATSVADTSRNDVATVTVSATPVVSVALSPPSASVQVNGTQSFTATVSGNANTSVTWSVQPPSGGGSLAPSGNSAVYTAPSAPGTYQVVATSVADTGKSASANVTVGLTAAPALSGTVAYAGSKTGRVYLSLQNGGGGQGTSLTAPGTFTIRGVQGNGNMTKLSAFQDVLGTGAYDYAADPYGSIDVTLTGADITGLTVTLADPPAPTTPGQAPQPFVIPATDSLVVGLDGLRDGQGRELATGYNLYWSTTPSPGPANKSAGAPKAVPPGGVGAVFLGSPTVTAGGTYYFSVSALNDTLEGPVSASVGPVTVAAPTGGTTVSGQVAFPGLSVTGPFIVGIYSKSGGAYYVRVTGTTSPQAFSIPGVPAGSYQLFSFIDSNSDGLVATGDPQAGFSGNSSAVTVGSGPVSGLNVTLASGDSTPMVSTRHSRYGGSDGYQLGPSVVSNLKRPVKVVLTSGPNVNVPVDIGLNFGNGGGTAQFGMQWDLGGTVPSVGQTYYFDVTYQDGSTGSVSASVSGVLSGLPTALTPSGSGASATPTLTWTLPGSLPSPYSLEVWVGGNNGGWDYSVAPGSTSVLYNVDGKGSALSSGGSYNWDVTISDQYGNQANDGQQFTVQ